MGEMIHMGHLCGNEEILKSLQTRLDKNPIGAPPHEALYRVLEILFTKKKLMWDLDSPSYHLHLKLLKKP